MERFRLKERETLNSKRETLYAKPNCVTLPFQRGRVLLLSLG